MKRFPILLLILAIGLSCCAAAASDPQAVSEQALPLLRILAMCPDLRSFDAQPDALTAREAVLAYRILYPEDGSEDSDVYALLFSDGVFPEEDPGAEEPLPAEVIAEAALDNLDGRAKVSIRADIDYGSGPEFGFFADVYLTPDPGSPFGARISGFFLPE